MIRCASRAVSAPGIRIAFTAVLITALLASNGLAVIDLPGCGRMEDIASSSGVEGFPGKTCCCGGTGACQCDMQQQTYAGAPVAAVAGPFHQNDAGSSLEAVTVTPALLPGRGYALPGGVSERARAPSVTIFTINQSFLC